MFSVCGSRGNTLAFSVPIPHNVPLRKSHFSSPAITATPKRPTTIHGRNHVLHRCKMCSAAGDDQESDSFFARMAAKEQEEERIWEEIFNSRPYTELTDEDEATLRRKLPSRIADFIIRRARPSSRNLENTIMGKLLRDKPLNEPAQPPEYDSYVYYPRAGKSDLDVKARRRALRESKPSNNGAVVPRTGYEPQSLFTGTANSVEEQAAQVGYGILAALALFAILKLAFAFIQFFVSFTFSFVAIFALGAGIFVFFVLARF